jgi:hypothetical protein
MVHVIENMIVDHTKEMWSVHNYCCVEVKYAQNLKSKVSMYNRTERFYPSTAVRRNVGE